MIDLGMPTLIGLPRLDDCGALCRELGLQFIELNMNLPQYQTDRLDAAALRRVREEYGVYFTLHLDENLNPGDFNPRIAEAYVRTAEDAIAFAEALEMPVLNMHLSRGIHFTLPGEKVYLFDQYREAYLARMRSFRDRCAAAAGQGGVRICVENTDGCRRAQIQALDLLLESPVFALTYDVGHNHGSGGGDEKIILRRREKLMHFHLHDAREASCHLPLGEGELDWKKYLRLAEAVNGRAVLEVKTAEGLRTSVRRLRAV